jgi:HD-like signal output (HDOD) protein
MKPTKEQFLAALKAIETFSPAPVILSNALKVLRDPNSDIESIATLVGRDTALVADILRCSNSAYYGRAANSSVAEAVQRIGLRETIRLLNLAVARIVSSRDLGCYGIAGSDYWTECLFNGLFLQTLAKEIGGADAEEAYTVGLLRFIGRLAIDKAISSLNCGLFWDGTEPIAGWELDNVGMTQGKAGAVLLRSWRFSETIVSAIAAQDEETPSDAEAWLPSALRFTSDLLPEGIGTPFLPAVGPTWTTTPVGSAFMHRHGLSPATVDSLLHSTSETFDRIRENFGA